MRLQHLLDIIVVTQAQPNDVAGGAQVGDAGVDGMLHVRDCL
jgi:hypothetical protein